MDLDILLTHGVGATIVHQEKAGDLVLLGPDVMHWVRATGKAICLAWNFMLGRAGEMGLYFRNLDAAESNWSNIVPIYWYAQENVLQGKGEGTVEPICRTLFAKRLVEYYMEEWATLSTQGDIQWANKPADLRTYPLFCRSKGCGKEIINALFGGYCVSCALARGGHTKALYLHRKEAILTKLRELLGGEDARLAELERLGQKVQGMP
jgi:hypothetical protein